MSHARYGALLAVYDRLAPGERIRVDRHLGGCRECAARLESYRRMDAALRALEDPLPPKGAPAMRADAFVRVLNPTGGGLRLVGSIAALLLLVVAVWIAVQRVPGEGGSAAETPTLTPTPTYLLARGTPARFAPWMAVERETGLAGSATQRALGVLYPPRRSQEAPSVSPLVGNVTPLAAPRPDP